MSIYSIEEALQIVVNEWWDSWHRFAEELDSPPEHIIAVIDFLYDQYCLEFDVNSGVWK